MTKRVHLRELDLQITNRCHQNCRHCCCSSGPKETWGPSPLQVQRLIEEASALGVEEIHVTGGEPLLRYDCAAIMDLIGKHGLASQLQSTGIGENSLKKFPIGENSLFMLSLDGLEENHDHYRGTGNFNQAIQIAEGVRAQGWPLRINTVVTKRNQSEIEEILLLAKSLGATVASFFYFSPIGRGRHIINDWIPPESYVPVVERVRTFVQNYSIRIPKTVYFQCGYDLVDTTWNRTISCRSYSRDFLVVLADGRVLPCTWYVDTNISLGNAFSEPLSSIIERYADFVDGMEALPKGCRDCALAERCKGGCPAACFLAGSERDPRCTIEYGIFPGCPEAKMLFTKE